MNDQVREQLRLIVTRYGPGILLESRRCRALLLDLCGEQRLEINLVVAALDEGVAARLAAPAPGVPVQVLLAQQVTMLTQVRGLNTQAAQWAVEAIAEAVGMMPTNLTPAAKPDPQPPSVARPTVAATPGRTSPFGLPSLTLATGVVLELVRISAGPFLMGSASSDSAAHDREKLQHTVTLGKYYIGKYEVTVAQWAAFGKATGYKGSQTASPGKDSHPVTNVSWDDAVAFTKWATQVVGRVVRLPTEAEWEKAARGADGRKYPWGNEAPDRTRCNFHNNVKDTTPVGKYSPRGDSPYGLADMSGSVWEWTASLYRSYPYVADDGREDAASRDPRVLRGGSFYFSARGVRSARRVNYNPNHRHDHNGFRVVASPIPR